MIEITYTYFFFIILYLGAKNYVLVDCPDVKKFVSCKLQDLSIDGKTETLSMLDFGKNLLLCGPFIPNNNPFYVQVNIHVLLLH